MSPEVVSRPSSIFANHLEPLRETKATMSLIGIEALELGIGVIVVYFALYKFNKNMKAKKQAQIEKEKALNSQPVMSSK